MFEKYYIFNETQQGYNHEKIGKICEDYSGCYNNNKGFTKIFSNGQTKEFSYLNSETKHNLNICCVADGHGSDNYPRTERGSKYAVQSAIECIVEFTNKIEKVKNEKNIIFEELLNDKKNEYLKQLSKSILKKWNEKVVCDYNNDNFTDEELKNVSAKYKELYVSINKNADILNDEKEQYKITKAYGTTLLVFVIIEEYCFGLQIGDGKVVVVNKDGDFSIGIPLDDSCNLNVTTSICDSNAIDEFHFYSFRKKDIVAVFCGSDGIDDSYINEEDLFELYRSILKISMQCDEKQLGEEIKEYLPILSRKGSGDDVSIAGIIDKKDIESIEDKIIKKIEEYKSWHESTIN